MLHTVNAQLLIVGTNHISEQSLRDIKNAFLTHQPAIIAVELDKERLLALTSPQQKTKFGLATIRAFGVRGSLFLLLGRYVQQKLGKIVGTKPGSEMLFAATLAKNNNLDLALIDKPIQQTVRRLFKQLTWKEKFRFAGDFFFAPFKKKQRISLSLTSVPSEDVITTLLLQVKGRYPTLYRVLVAERDTHMARQLALLSKKHPHKKILAIVGAGHLAGMKEELPSLLQHIDIV